MGEFMKMIAAISRGQQCERVIARNADRTTVPASRTAGRLLYTMALQISVIFVALLSADSSLAQTTNAGDLRGTATDSTGAVIPGVKVTVLDVDKGVTTTYVTDGAGLYDTGSIVPDHYTVTFTKQGFTSFVRGPFTLLVQILTIDAHLSPGSTTQTVSVTTDAPLLETETGALSTTLTGKELTDLPNFASWETFTILMPGASGTPSNGNSNVDPGQAVSVNGNATFYNLLDDGAVVTMPDSGNGEDYPIDILAEVKMDTNAFGAQYANGGVIYNSISKGGSNQFHGDAFDYFQNTVLNAAPYSFGATAAVPVIRANFYGGSIGGPVLRNRLFFFANADLTQKYGGSSNGFVTVPTAAMLAGDFTGFPTIYDPTTQTVGAGGVVQRASFASEYGNGNKIPTSMIDSVANAIQKYYPAPNVPGVVTNGITTNNFFYNVPSNSPEYQWFWRVDYDISPKNRLTVTDLQNTGNTPNLGIGICPVDCYNSSGTAVFAEATDVWTFSPEANNEFRFGMANEVDNYLSETVNQGYPAKLGLLFAKGDEFPSININSEFELQPGIDSTQHQSDFNPSDVVTLIRGKHILHFGGDELIQRNNSTAWGNVQAANLQFTGQYTASSQGTQNISGVPYADFLLGDSESWSATNTPEEGTRYKVVETFIQDDIKVHPNLTLNAGLRWEGFTGIGEIHGNALSFDPTIPNPGNNTLGAMWNGITKADGRQDIQAGVWDTFLPRLGLAWQPMSNTVIRGGFGIFAYPFSGETTFGLGSALGSSGSQYDATNGVDPVVILSSSGGMSYQGSPGGINSRYLNAPLTPDGYNGQSVPYNQYNTPATKIYQYNLTIQRAISSGMTADASYVGSHGFDEIFPANINQVPEDMLGPNDASGSTNARPYTLFQGISGATHNARSNYNSLQTAIEGRWASGPQFNINYTWSKYLDESDICPWNCGTKAANYQNAYVPSDNYGPSDFDIRSMLKGRIFYPLPVGKGQRFLNNNSIPSEVLGGWRIATTFQWQSGNAFTPVMVNNTSYAQAGAQYPNLVGNPKSGPHGTTAEWFDVNAFAAPTPGTFGDVRSNSVRGPGLSNVNVSLGKNFSVWERALLQIRVDATNAFNHPSFGLPDTGIGPGHTGQITSVTVGGRSAELVGKISF
jgi:hypothetical protein